MSPRAHGHFVSRNRQQQHAITAVAARHRDPVFCLTHSGVTLRIAYDNIRRGAVEPLSH